MLSDQIFDAKARNHQLRLSLQHW